MCPDKEILSAFIDDELEGKLKDDIKNHISACKKCCLEVESFNSLHNLLSEHSLGSIKDAEEKVWNRITPVLKPKAKKINIWHMRIAIPVPVMAAALLIFISSVISLYFISFNKIDNSYESKFNFSESISFDKEEDFNMFEKDLVLDVDVNLPESTVFMASGSPKLIREVDYLNTNR